MAEDSGAFKTNSPNSAGFRHFVITRDGRCRQASPVKKTLCGIGTGVYATDF
jgi:hypothetical protein